MTTKRKFPKRAFSRPRTAGTVALQVLVDAQRSIEIGQRIRELREASPHTNRSIADYCHVSERAVSKWVQGKGISWDNLECVAELFDVDVDYLWRGTEKGEAPDLMGSLSDNGARELAEVRRELAVLHEKLDEVLSNQSELLSVASQIRTEQERQQRRQRRGERGTGGSRT